MHSCEVGFQAIKLLHFVVSQPLASLLLDSRRRQGPHRHDGKNLPVNDLRNALSTFRANIEDGYYLFTVH